MAAQSVVLCPGVTSLAALFGIQQQPGSLASSLSVGPQHLFPLLCRNFLYLAGSRTLAKGAQVTVSNSASEMKLLESTTTTRLFPPPLPLLLQKDNIRLDAVHSTWEEYKTFLTRVSKCHVVPRMLLTRRIAVERKLSPVPKHGRNKKRRKKRAKLKDILA